jgi:hypothetical protein
MSSEKLRACPFPENTYQHQCVLCKEMFTREGKHHCYCDECKKRWSTRAEQPPEAATHYPECPHGTDRRVPCENCQKVAETDGENQVIIERLKGEVERLTSDIESGFAKGSYARLRNLQEAEVERDQLRDALIRLRDCDWTITLPDRMDAVRTIARKALAAGEQQGEA